MFFPLPTWIIFMCPSHSTLYKAFQAKHYWKPKHCILLLFLQCFISIPCLHHPQLAIIQQLWKPLQEQPTETWWVQSSLSSPCWKTTHFWVFVSLILTSLQTKPFTLWTNKRNCTWILRVVLSNIWTCLCQLKII